MRRAALYVEGKIVVADSHVMAFMQLQETEKNGNIVSGFFDPDTEEFDSDLVDDHFYNKELILVRHTQTLHDGPNPHLSEEGKVEAEKIAHRLKDYDLSDYQGLTSPFNRCLETAEILHERLDIPFSVEPEIGETPDFLKENENCLLQNLCCQFTTFDWPSGNFLLQNETKDQFRDRTKRVLQRIPHRCIVVTHFGIIYNISQIALCPRKAEKLLSTGVPKGNVAYINKDVIQIIRTDENENLPQNRRETECQ